MERTGVMEAYTRHDAFLFPSLHDSSGNAVLEALSCGLPVVCLDVGGPAVLVDAACGFRVPPGTPERAVRGLADALATLATDPALADAMGRAAERHAQEQFSWQHQVSLMEHVYFAVCGAARPSPRAEQGEA
jgi:glycosyltransferase involved in cell wall biosynthesis